MPHAVANLLRNDSMVRLFARPRERKEQLRQETLSELKAVLADIAPEKGMLTDPAVSRKHTQKILDLLLGGIDLSEVSPAGNPHRERGGFHPLSALECIHDLRRTERFLTAWLAHLDRLHVRKPGGGHVVDVGCGPAALFAAVAALASPHTRITALDIHPDSVRIARAVAAKFGVEDRLRIQEADALTYVLEEPADLLVSETMDSAMTNGEQMLPILANFRPQMAEGGVMLPEYVTVDAGLKRITPAQVGLPTFREAARFCAGDVVQEIVVRVPLTDLEGGEYGIQLSSTVGLDGEAVVLRPSDLDCALTCPVDVTRRSSPRIRSREDDDEEGSIFVQPGTKDYGTAVIRYKPGTRRQDLAFDIDFSR